MHDHRREKKNSSRNKLNWRNRRKEKNEINGVVQAVDLAKKHDIDSILKAKHNFNLTAS